MLQLPVRHPQASLALGLCTAGYTMLMTAALQGTLCQHAIRKEDNTCF